MILAKFVNLCLAKKVQLSKYWRLFLYYPNSCIRVVWEPRGFVPQAKKYLILQIKTTFKRENSGSFQRLIDENILENDG